MIYQLFLAFASIIDYSSQLVKKIPIELIFNYLKIPLIQHLYLMLGLTRKLKVLNLYVT